jgi:hypothetical protein
VHTVAEAEQASHSQATSPTPKHHVPAHKHAKHSSASSAAAAKSKRDQEADDEEHDDDDEVNESVQAEGEDEAEEDEGSEEEGSGSEESESSEEDGEKFPYEKNLFSLCPSYHFIKRLYTCDDAVTYKAFSKLTNQVVAIKICDGYDGKVTPKEVRLLNTAQGHNNICVMNGWHPFGANHCYAIITEFIENEPIEIIFDHLPMHKVYMRDLLSGLQHLHDRQ